jgi:parvulin-like peptidyl-prolyl isomerase
MKRTIFLTIFGLLIAVCAFAQFDIKTIAVVNLIRSEPIMGRQFRTEVERVERATRRTLTVEERQEMLDAMINEALVIQAAERDRVSVSEAEVNQQIQQLRNALAQQLGRQPTDAEFAQAVRNESDMELPAFREQLRRQLILQKYLMTKKESLISSIRPPTAEEVQTEFNLRRADFVRPETVEFTGIQIPYGQDAAARTRARELADRLVREIGSDVSKFDAAVERAIMPNSGYRAGSGSLPKLPETQRELGQDFVNIAFSLRQGTVSRLIETPNDYVIIKVTRNLELKTLELDDVVPGHLLMRFGVDPRVSITVRNLLYNVMAAAKQQAVLSQATQELVAELRSGRSFQILERNLTW